MAREYSGPSKPKVTIQIHTSTAALSSGADSAISRNRPTSRLELIVNDPKRIAVVKLEEYWYDENR